MSTKHSPANGRKTREDAQKGVSIAGTTVRCSEAALDFDAACYRLHESRHRSAADTDRELDQQLWHLQQLASVGQLALGIAHDFANSMTAVNVYHQLLADSLDPTEPLQQLLDGMQKAIERSTTLTQQLMTLSRKRTPAFKDFDLNDSISDFAMVATRVISETIRLCTDLSPNLPKINADPDDIQRVLLNLVMNAQDAMPSGGSLRIDTSVVKLERADCQRLGATRPGDYILMAVSDSGIGMSPELVQNVFEPFFTTKRGTAAGCGLGLSVVHDIVTESKGFIEVHSAPGQGACFKIYFPRVKSSTRPRTSNSDPDRQTNGGETILLVEDERGVRHVLRELLCAHGYHVLTAQDGAEATDLHSQFSDSIALLITDVTMPGLPGPALARQLRVTSPELKVLFISGYPNAVTPECPPTPSRTVHLQKPILPKLLVKTIREVLDGI